MRILDFAGCTKLPCGPLVGKPCSTSVANRAPRLPPPLPSLIGTPFWMKLRLRFQVFSINIQVSISDFKEKKHISTKYPDVPKTSSLGIILKILSACHTTCQLGTTVEKVGNLGSSLPGNVGIWIEILEFGGKMCHMCLNLEACLLGN